MRSKISCFDYVISIEILHKCLNTEFNACCKSSNKASQNWARSLISYHIPTFLPKPLSPTHFFLRLALWDRQICRYYCSHSRPHLIRELNRPPISTSRPRFWKFSDRDALRRLWKFSGRDPLWGPWSSWSSSIFLGLPGLVENRALGHYKLSIFFFVIVFTQKSTIRRPFNQTTLPLSVVAVVLIDSLARMIDKMFQIITGTLSLSPIGPSLVTHGMLDWSWKMAGVQLATQDVFQSSSGPRIIVLFSVMEEELR